MQLIQRQKKLGRIILLFCSLSFIMVFPLFSQEGNTGRRQFYDLVELTKIIQRARDAGFSEEELKNLELKDAGTTINVYDYMNEILARQRIEDEKLKDFLSKRFLTVGDVYQEMVNLEPDELTKLREELVSER
jgi:DNA-binding transcriptional MerR regulator